MVDFVMEIYIASEDYVCSEHLTTDCFVNGAQCNGEFTNELLFL